MIPNEFQVQVGSDPIRLKHEIELGENLLLAAGILFAAVVIVRIRK